MQIISELEQTARGPYAGCVGYFSFNGNLDTCITSAPQLIKDGKAYVQAGALGERSTPRRIPERSTNHGHAEGRGAGGKFREKLINHETHQTHEMKHGLFVRVWRG